MRSPVYTHGPINLPIAAIAYFINTLDSQSPGRARGGPKLFQSWGPFLQNMYLPLCQFSKKNLIRYVLGKVSNFDLIFYVIRTLHKKTRQSLWPSLGRIRWDFFFENWHRGRYIFCKKGPQLWNSLAHTRHAQTSDCQGCLFSKP